jgi:hypothetical protein
VIVWLRDEGRTLLCDTINGTGKRRRERVAYLDRNQ